MVPRNYCLSTLQSGFQGIYILAVLHGLNEDSVAVDFHHNHDALVATKRFGGELACLVREHGFAYHVDGIMCALAVFICLEGQFVDIVENLLFGCGPSCVAGFHHGGGQIFRLD
jgi:hypothetical protein